MNKCRHILFSFLAIILFWGIILYTSGAQALTHTVNVSTVLVSNGNCSINTDGATLNFGTLNPLAPELEVFAFTENGKLSFSCNGNGQDDITYSINVTNSIYGTATTPAMQHEDGIFNLPYEITSLNPASGTIPKVKGQPLILQLVVTGKVLGNDYKNAPVGALTDTLTISITP